MSNAHPDPFEGTERFEKIRRIGTGGMGIVYEAYDRKRQMPVAVKTLHGREATALYRFKREFRSLSNISHRNLAALHELFAEADPWFFTMELVNGVTFLDYVTPQKPSTPAWAATHNVGGSGSGELTDMSTRTTQAPASSVDYERLYAALGELVAGLSELHTRNKLHRDIKPSNVLVEPEGRVVILDFGLVTDLQEQLLSSFPERDWLGTIAYMAPEQVLGDDLTEATDWYCVGGMLYEALTGRPPFVGDREAVIKAKLGREPPPPRQFNPEIPEPIAQLCVDLLRRNPEQRASKEEIIDLFGHRPLVVAASSLAAVHKKPTPLVGRQPELAVLENAMTSVRPGRSVAMYVHGQSGAGKTALIENFLHRLIEQEDVLVLSGRCYERESVPYKALDSVVDFLSRYLTQLPASQVRALVPTDGPLLVETFPVLAAVGGLAESAGAQAIRDQQERRRRAIGAFRVLLSRLAERIRVVLYIDDLQWGDLDSAVLIDELFRQPGGPGVLFLATYRKEDAETSPCLRSLMGTSAVASGIDRRQLPLEALSSDDAGRLAYELLDEDGPAARALAESIAREAGGNPLFVHELVSYVRGGQSLTADPITLDGVLRRRFSRLPQESRRLLELVAVAGQPLPEAVAYRAADLQRLDPAVLAVLRNAQLVRTTGSGDATAVETYHDRIRETVASSLEPAIRRHHHKRLALTLEASGQSDPDTLAAHFHGAADLATAGHYYDLAADSAARALAFDRAADFYRRSRDLKSPIGDELRALGVKLGDVLANAGRGWEAAREYQAAREGAADTDVLDLQRRAGYQYCISGHVQEGRLALRDALRRVGMTMSPTPRRALWPLLRDRVLLRLRGTSFRDRDAATVSPNSLAVIDAVWSAGTGLAQIDVITAAAFQARNLLLSLRAGEPYRVSRALALEAMSSALEGTSRQHRTAALLTRARVIAERIQEPHALGMVALVDGVAAVSMGRWEDGWRALADAEAIFRTRCAGVIWELATLHHHRVWALALRGLYGEMISYGTRVLDEARERGDVYTPATIGMFVESLERLLADDATGSRNALREVARRWTHKGSSLQRIMENMQDTFIDLYIGDGVSAWDRLNEWWPDLLASHLLRLEQMRIQMFHLRAACAIQAGVATRSNRLLQVAKRDARRLERERAPWARPEAQVIDAALAVLRGNRAVAVNLLGKAAAHCETLGRGQFGYPARRQQGLLMGGDEGRQIVALAESSMIQQGIRNPERWTALHVPGFTL